MYNISYKSSVEKDLKRINLHHRKKLIDEIEKTLPKNPTAGKQLKGEFHELRSLRIGNYRVVYKIILQKEILILRISHRKDVYR